MYVHSSIRLTHPSTVSADQHQVATGIHGAVREYRKTDHRVRAGRGKLIGGGGHKLGKEGRRFMNAEVERKGDCNMGFHTSKDTEMNEIAWGRLNTSQTGVGDETPRHS